jgi:hypothetical protein
MTDPKSYLLSRIDVNEKTGCWDWKAYKDKYGYGVWCTGSHQSNTRRYIKTHRLSYEIFKGSIPDGKLVCHTCDNRSCVNPDHLFCGDWNDNVQDMVSKGRNKIIINPMKGSKNGKSKLSENDINFIRSNHFSVNKITGLTTSKMACLFDVDRTTIQRIMARRGWRHV